MSGIWPRLSWPRERGMRLLCRWRSSAINQFAAQLALGVGVDGGVDRLVRHVALALAGKHPLERTCDLLGRPLPMQQRGHHRPVDAAAAQLAGRPRLRLTLFMPGLRLLAAAARLSISVAPEFPADCRCRPAQLPPDLPDTAALQPQARQHHPLFGSQLLVCPCSFHMYTSSGDKVLQFKLEPAPLRLSENLAVFAP